ncbi:hypothetical protein [Nonomuraea sp. NPDC050202]|uniref:hypothetical protein n=1 Tax=Nonomuraea sp. NPDC050202 TaxID=3155035 RepID=UPI0033C26CCC
MPHRTDVAAAAAQADEAAASFAGQGMEKEWAISRCMASHYKQALANQEEQ